MKPGAVTQILSSWWVTAALLVTLAACYVFLTFGEDAYVRWTGFLFHSPAGIGLYCALIVNLMTATVRVAARGLSRPPCSREAILGMDAWAELAAGSNGLEAVAAWLRDKGFRAVREADCVFARRGVWSFLPGTVLRVGLAGLLISLLVSVHMRQAVTAVVHAGEEKEFFGARVTAGPVEALLPDDFLQVGDESSFLLQNARLRISSGGKTCEIGPGLPTKLNGNYYRLTHLGYAQPLSVATGGKTFDRTSDIDVLPPGKTQIIPLPAGAVFLSIALEPDRTISKGLLKGKQYNLRSPFYRVLIQSGRAGARPAAVRLRQGEGGKAGGASISIGATQLYARIDVVKDPALFWVYCSLALSGIGLVMMLSRFFWFRKQVAAVSSGGMIVIGVQEEFFKKWGIQHFYEWKKGLADLVRKK